MNVQKATEKNPKANYAYAIWLLFPIVMTGAMIIVMQVKFEKPWKPFKKR